MKKLYWLDLETTGLDPRADVILELAVAEANLKTPYDWTVCTHAVLPYRRNPDELHPKVKEMHTASGLFEECARIEPIINGVSHLTRLEDELLTIVPDVGTEDRERMPSLAGASVHFDREFLKVHMPRLAKRFSSRIYDVSAIKLFCRSLGMPDEHVPFTSEAHRAKDDLKECMRHLRMCEDWLRSHYAQVERDRIKHHIGSLVSGRVVT